MSSTEVDRAELAHLDLKQATHHAAKRHPLGIGGIAGAYGLNPHTFQNKLAPTQPSCINIEEFEMVLQATRSPLILDAIGRVANCTWIDLGSLENTGDLAVLDTILSLVNSVGQLTGDLQRAIADGVVTQREFAGLTQDFKSLCGKGYAVLERAEQLLEADWAAHAGAVNDRANKLPESPV